MYVFFVKPAGYLPPLEHKSQYKENTIVLLRNETHPLSKSENVIRHGERVCLCEAAILGSKR